MKTPYRVYGFLLGFCLLFALHLSHHWSYTWDDSAITLAYARQLAESGEIRPSLYSDRVEGYSTFLWMIMMAGVARLNASPDVLLLVAKLFSSALILLSAGLLYILAGRLLQRPGLRLFVVAGFLFSSSTAVEALNGMETPLACFLLLLAVFFKTSGRNPHPVAFILVTLLFMLVRYENAFFLIPFILLDWPEKGWQSFFQPAVWVWIAVFVAYHAWHYSYFQGWVPNTVLAKQQMIVAPNTETVWGALMFHSKPLLKFLVSYSPLIAAGIACAVTARTSVRSRLHSVPDAIRLCALLFGFGMAFAVIVGDNTGHINRMLFPFLPLFLILLAYGFEQMHCPARFYTLGLAAFVLLGLLFVYQEMNRHITVAKYKTVAEALNKIRSLWGNDKLVYAGPDMGGVLLYGKGLRVIDLAMLNNRPLAAHGYAILDSLLFEVERPDVIEIHTRWSRLSGIDTLNRFYQRYERATVDGLTFYLHNRLIRDFSKKGLLERRPRHTLPQHPTIDQRIHHRFGEYYRLIDPS